MCHVRTCMSSSLCTVDTTCTLRSCWGWWHGWVAGHGWWMCVVGDGGWCGDVGRCHGQWWWLRTEGWGFFMMPKLSIGKCWHSIWESVATTNWTPFHLLGYMVHAWYSYIYMPNSIILLNTSDSIWLQQSPMHDSNGVWCVLDKTHGKKVQLDKQTMLSPMPKKSPIRVWWNPSESIRLPWE